MYGYQFDRPGFRCAPGPTPGAIALRDGVLEVEPRLVDLGIYNCRPPRGVNPGPGVRVSLHGEGRAWDAGTPSKELGDWLAAMMVMFAPRLGVQEVIWWRRRWGTETEAWAPYGGRDPHTGHVHVGLCWAASSTLRKPMVVEAFRPADDDEENTMAYKLLEQNDGADKGRVFMVTPAGPVPIQGPTMLQRFRDGGLVDGGAPIPTSEAQLAAWVHAVT